MREVAVERREDRRGPDRLHDALGLRGDLRRSRRLLSTDRLTLQPPNARPSRLAATAQRLDLFADVERSADAIGDFAGQRGGRGLSRVLQTRRRDLRTLREHVHPRVEAQPVVAARRASAFGDFRDLVGISPFATLWSALGEYFRDQRLRQLFGRYATYCGSSPFAAPATLMLVAHVEQRGRLAASRAACIDWLRAWPISRSDARRDASTMAARVERIHRRARPRRGVATDDGERICRRRHCHERRRRSARRGALGEAAKRSGRRIARSAARSLSAVTWAINARDLGLSARASQCVLLRRLSRRVRGHFQPRRLPRAPTVYVCAQDRDDDETPGATARTPSGCFASSTRRRRATRTQSPQRRSCHAKMRVFQLLGTMRAEYRARHETTIRTTPQDFARLFPATGGALYGRASHGWMASFARPGSRTRLPGLYLAGGSAHPGPGVPMAALSGRLAAQSVSADLTSTQTVRPGRLCLVVYRRAQRRRSSRTDGHRIHRQRLLALLRLVWTQDPLEHCAMNVALYGPTSQRWAMTERGARRRRRARKTSLQSVQAPCLGTKTR